MSPAVRVAIVLGAVAGILGAIAWLVYREANTPDWRDARPRRRYAYSSLPVGNIGLRAGSTGAGPSSSKGSKLGAPLGFGTASLR